MTYTIVDGEILSENRSGTQRQYVPDPLGSTVALLDTTTAIAKNYSYWSYGGIQSGDTSATKYLFVGTLGGRRQLNGDVEFRYRELDPDDGRWSTTDSLWPLFAAFLYAYSSPATFRDPWGLAACQQAPPIPGVDPPRPPYQDCLDCIYGECNKKFKKPKEYFDCALAALAKRCKKLCGADKDTSTSCFALLVGDCFDDCTHGSPLQCSMCIAAVAARCDATLKIGPITIGGPDPIPLPGPGLGGPPLCVSTSLGGKYTLTCCYYPDKTLRCIITIK